MKLIYDGVTLEGTPEEIKEMMTAMGAEFPEAKSEEPEEVTPTFRKGDRAKLLSTKGALAGFTAGEEVTVRNQEHWGRHDLEVEGVTHGIIGYTDADNLEKITFEVGDRVRTLTDGQFDDIEAGEIGEVTAIDAGIDDGDPYSIEVTVGDEGDFFRPQDLELVPATDEEKNARKFTEIDRKPGEFKKGDIVRVIDSPNALPVGTIFEISSIISRYAVDHEGNIYDVEKRIEIIAPVESRVDVG